MVKFVLGLGMFAVLRVIGRGDQKLDGVYDGISGAVESVLVGAFRRSIVVMREWVLPLDYRWLEVDNGCTKQSTSLLARISSAFFLVLVFVLIFQMYKET